MKCTRCGFCCLSEMCEAAIMVIGQSNSICPFLRWKEGVSVCWLVQTEIQNNMEPILAKALAIGKGYPNEMPEIKQRTG